MPQITAYVNKSDHARWMRVERKADVVKWLLDRYEAGDIELPTKTTKPAKQVPQVSDDDIEREMPIIKTPADALKAVEPITPHQNFLKKSKKK
jgi:hypothetical protein